ncbi:transmembrane protein [Cystoisospora suis]|uniref:Transmembrane protein n=1 Tax=Cystoisospora suis TaxID=483139 RepID=A0A2C6LB25_9APIC|nr:transmembrane protein [Cystoisospora suis]
MKHLVRLAVALSLCSFAVQIVFVRGDTYDRSGSFSFDQDLLETTQHDTYNVHLEVGDTLTILCKNGSKFRPSKFPEMVCLSDRANCKDDAAVNLKQLFPSKKNAVTGGDGWEKPVVLTVPDEMRVPTRLSFACLSPKNHAIQFEVDIPRGIKNLKTWAGTDPEAFSAAVLSTRASLLLPVSLGLAVYFGSH